MQTIVRTAFAAALFLLATGFTECEYFQDVVVPAQDSSPPVPFNGIWYRGEYKAITFQHNPLHYAAEPGENIVIVAGGVDPGGTRRVVLGGAGAMTCCRPSGCSTTRSVTLPIVEVQDGAVGSTVSNGVWASTGFTAPGCDAGATSGSWRYTWQVVAEDFHGNRVTGPSSSASWELN